MASRSSAPDPLHARAFLDLSPANRPSGVANIVLKPIRQRGITEPRAVLVAVVTDMVDRQNWARRRGYPDDMSAEIVEAIAAHRDKALDYAGYCVRYEALPKQDRERLKSSRSAEAIRAHMDREEPTEKQVAYVRRQGYDGPIDSKAHASALIDIYLRGYQVTRRDGAAW